MKGLPTILPHGLIEHPLSTKDDRAKTIGGTDARIIASGDWLDLFNIKTGRTKAPDLHWIWKPRLGLETEELHAIWHELRAGVTTIEMPDRPLTTAPMLQAMPFVHVTLDYLVENDTCLPLELKHTNERNDLRTAATYYMAQLQHQMLVTGADSLHFSIIRGNNEPEWGVVERDQDYINTLLAQLKQFWWHVTNDEAPAAVDQAPVVALGKLAGGVKIDGLKPYDMSSNNEWVSTAADFIAQKRAADSFKETEKKMRALIPSDASEVKGGGLSFKRDARGAYRVTIHD